MNTSAKETLKALLAAVAIALFVGGPLFWLFCLNHVSINELGIAYDARSGAVNVQETPGFYRTSPFVKVTYLTTQPIRVTIPSDAAVIVTKIVKFKKEGVDEFIRLQGFSYQMNSSLPNILLGYAFSGKLWPFMDIMQEGGPETETLNTAPLYRGGRSPDPAKP